MWATSPRLGAARRRPWVTLAAVANGDVGNRIGTAVTPRGAPATSGSRQQVGHSRRAQRGRVVFGAGSWRRVGVRPVRRPVDARVRAELLDEGLDLPARLLGRRGGAHRGAHYNVTRSHGVALKPCVPERLPVWIGGNRPASLRRAARWDGWIADSSGIGDRMLSPAELTRSIETIRTARSTDEPFDVAVLAQSGQGDPAAYSAAGATWWLENVHDRRGRLDEMQALVEAGPPT